MRALTTITEQGHDTAVGIALIVLSLLCLAVWAVAEGLLTRARRAEAEQTAVARAVGVLRDRRTPATDEAFADLVEARLRNERGVAGDEMFLLGAVILAVYFTAVLAVIR